MKRIIDVICFSGTGNTKLVVDRIVKRLNEQNINICRKQEKESYTHEKGHELLLAFPVNSQSVSPYIWKYMKSLPEGNGDKVHVVVTLNESAGIIAPLRKLLVKKGYQPQGVVEISMPNHLIIGTDSTSGRFVPAMIKADNFANEILHNSDTWKEEKKGSAFVSFLSRDTVLPWTMMRLMNKLEADPSKCMRCGLCAKECPVHNIRMQEFPVHLNHCEFCMHCGMVCKSGAIRIKGKPKYQIQKTEEIFDERNK